MKPLENFAMMIPQYWTAPIGVGCHINVENATDLAEFKKWIEEKNLIQLEWCNSHLDLWQMRNDLVISDGYRIQKWFDIFKSKSTDSELEVRSYGFKSFEIDNKFKPGDEKL